MHGGYSHTFVPTHTPCVCPVFMRIPGGDANPNKQRCCAFTRPLLLRGDLSPNTTRGISQQFVDLWVLSTVYTAQTRNRLLQHVSTSSGEP